MCPLKYVPKRYMYMLKRVHEDKVIFNLLATIILKSMYDIN